MELMPTIDSLPAEERARWALCEATLRPVDTETAIATVHRELDVSHPDFAGYLADYLEEHEGKKTLFAWVREKEIALLYCPIDQTARFFFNHGNLSGVGQVKPAIVSILASVARAKNLSGAPVAQAH